MAKPLNNPYASRRYTLAEYFELSAASAVKLEFREGQILVWGDEKGSLESDSTVSISAMEQAVKPPGQRYTLDEYFALAEASEDKLEFRSGEILSMAGGTESHSLIITNVAGELRSRLKSGPCRVYDSNLRVRAQKDQRYAYPDALVVCGERQFDPRDTRNLTVTNPTLIVEVLSDSTEASDRGEKFMAYIKAESLREYLLVSQTTPRVQSYFRQPDGGWSFTYFEGLEATARLRSLQIDLPLSEVYAKVQLPPADGFTPG
jgi:Uma2 family endonuclease